jgi:hypothetical protein
MTLALLAFAWVICFAASAFWPLAVVGSALAALAAIRLAVRDW